MATINVDTVKLKECGKDIMTISTEIGNELENLFERIAQMPTVTKEWVGQGAIAYAQKAQAEKIQYMQLKDTLYNYGKYLVDCSNKIDTEVNNIKNG